MLPAPRLLFPCLFLFAVASVAAEPSPARGYATRKIEAFQLAETAPADGESRLRALLTERPDDPDVLLRLGRLVFDHGRALGDERASERAVILREARGFFARARDAGSEEPLIATALDGINPDGSLRTGQFSEDPAVNAALQEAEQAYLRHDFEQARAAYRKVLVHDPRNYLATLYTGDAYFAAGKLMDAAQWFQRAAELEPDRETAHRYQGDALLRLDRRTEALDHYIEAVIAEPGSPYARRALENGCRAMLIKPWIPGAKVGRGTVAPGADGKPEIHLPPDANATDIYYTAARARWQAEHRPNPGETYRLTLAEEVAALHTVLEGWAEMKRNATTDPKVIEPLRPLEPSLEQLQEIEAAGLLETHILLFRGGADLAPDYAEFRRTHREQLRAYLRHYYLHLP